MRRSYLWLEQVFENRLVALVLASAVIVPLVATPADSSLRGLAAFAFEFLGVLLLAALLWRGRLNLNRENVSQFLRTGANLPILLYLGIVAISTAFSPHREVAGQELLRTGVGVLLYFVVAYQFRRVHHLAKLIDTLLYLAIVSSLIGFTHYATSAEQKATGQFGDHQLFGSFLMILLPMLVVTAVTESRRNRQLAAQIATVLTCTCLLLTHARGAWIGAGASLITMAALGMIHPKQRTKWMNRKHEWILPIMLVLASVGFFLTIYSGSASIEKRATTLSSGTAVADISFQDRIARWTGTLKMIGDHPLRGVGPGAYPFVQYEYTGKGYDSTFVSHYNNLYQQAHSLYLQTAAELGLPGLLLLVSIIVTFFIAGVRQVGTMHRDFRRNLLIGSLGATAAFAIDAVASPSWQFGNITMFLWMMMGVGASCMLPSAQEDPIPAKAAVPAKPARAIAVPICLAMAAVLPTASFSAQPLYNPPTPAGPQAPNSTPPAIAGGIVAGYLIGGVLTGQHHGGGGGEGASANTRLLEPGDVIDILVGGHDSDLSKTVKVGKDGRIPYQPGVSDDPSNEILAAGMTANELAATLQKRLLEFSKISQGDQVIVRLNPKFLEHQARDRKKDLDKKNTITQNGDGAQINMGDEQSSTEADQTSSANQPDTKPAQGE